MEPRIHIAKSDIRIGSHTEVLQSGNRQPTAPAANGHTFRINTAGLRLSAKVMPLAKSALQDEAYPNDTLAELYIIYHCMLHHPEFVNKPFTDLKEGIDYLISEVTRLFGNTFCVVYGPNFRNDTMKKWYSPRQMPIPDRAFVSTAFDAGVGFHDFKWLEIKGVNQEQNRAIRPVLIAAIRLLNEMNFSYIEKDTYMAGDDYYQEDAIQMMLDDTSPEDLPEVEKTLAEMKVEQQQYHSLQQEIQLLDPVNCKKIIAAHIKKQPATKLTKWLTIIMDAYENGLDIDEYRIDHMVLSDDEEEPIVDTEKVSLVYNAEWLVYKDVLSYASELAGNNGNLPMFCGEVVSTTGYTPAVQSSLHIIRTIELITLFDLSKLTWIKPQVEQEDLPQDDLLVT